MFHHQFRKGNFHAPLSAILIGSAGSVFAVTNSTESRDGDSIKRIGLGLGTGDCRGQSFRENQEHSRAESALPRAQRSCRSARLEGMRLPDSGGSDQELWSCSLSLRLAQFGVDTRSQYDLGLRADAGRQWSSRMGGPRSADGRGAWICGSSRIMHGYHGARRKYSLPQRSWSYERVYEISEGQSVDASKKQQGLRENYCWKNEGCDYEGCEEGPRASALFQDEGSKAQDQSRAFKIDEGYAWRSRKTARRNRCQKESGSRKRQAGVEQLGRELSKHVPDDASDRLLDRVWQGRERQNHLAFQHMLASDRAWKKWQEDRVWIEVGNQSNPRWLCVVVYVRGHDGLRRNLCGPGRGRAHSNFWRASEGLRVRQSGLERGTHEADSRIWREESWDCAEGPSEMGSGSAREGPHDSRASPSRGKNRRNEATRTKQTRCKDELGNATISTAGGTLLQPASLRQGFGNERSDDNGQPGIAGTDEARYSDGEGMWITAGYPQGKLKISLKKSNFFGLNSRTDPKLG